MPRELIPCRYCGLDFGVEHLAHPIDIVIDGNVEDASLCLRCLDDFDASIVDQAGAARWSCELALAAASRPSSESTEGERRNHAHVTSWLRDPLNRGALLESIGEIAAAAAARPGTGMTRGRAEQEISGLIDQWEQRRESLADDPSALRAWEVGLEGLLARFAEVAG